METVVILKIITSFEESVNNRSEAKYLSRYHIYSAIKRVIQEKN